MIKTESQLNALPTPRLLALYRAERKRHFKFDDGCRCECCGDYYWLIDETDKYNQELREKLHKSEDYVNSIKTILSTREHVKKDEKRNFRRNKRT